MRREAQEPTIDVGLERLLDAERSVERRIEEARRAAAARVAAARDDATRVAGEAGERLEAAVREEEKIDRERHAEEARRISTETQARVGALARVSDEALDRLARKLVARVVDAGGRR